MRRRGLRWLLVIAVLVGGGLILSRLAFGAQNSAQTTSVIQDETLVEVGDLNVTVSATGVVAPARQVTLVFELSAPVKEVLVRAGQLVKAGDVLARLDVADLEASLEGTRLALELQQIAYDALNAPARDVDIAAAQAALDSAWAQVNAANASAPDATRQEIARLQTELARNRLWQQQLQLDNRLNPPEAPPGVPISAIPVLPDDQRQQIESGLRQADYEVQIASANQDGVAGQGPDVGSLSAASAQVVSAQTQLERLVDGPSDIDLSMAELELERARLALDLAESNLDRAVLVAPFDGIAAQVSLTVGELPPSAASGGAVELIGASSYYIDLAVDETDVVAVATGQPAALAFDALPETRISGTVTRIAPTPTRIGQVVTYTTRVTLDPTLEPVRAGMNATATVIVNQLENVLLLRNRFIRIDRSTQEAFVTIQRPDGRFEEVQVELGLRNDTNSEIVSGVTAGQRVVLLPRESLIPGFGGGR